MPTLTLASCWVPSISHTQVSPLFGLVHNMSDLPSPLKSPVPSILYLAPPCPTCALASCWLPFICQTQVSLVFGFDHRMSDLPSPLKSFGAVRFASEISVPLPPSCA